MLRSSETEKIAAAGYPRPKSKRLAQGFRYILCCRRDYSLLQIFLYSSRQRYRNASVSVPVIRKNIEKNNGSSYLLFFLSAVHRRPTISPLANALPVSSSTTPCGLQWRDAHRVDGLEKTKEENGKQKMASKKNTAERIPCVFTK
ncbi:unnamed protein product [Victoria cruziana]